jgi:hypothetical protein
MPRVGFEPMIPMFELAKTFHASNPVPTELGHCNITVLPTCRVYRLLCSRLEHWPILPPNRKRRHRRLLASNVNRVPICHDVTSSRWDGLQFFLQISRLNLQGDVFTAVILQNVGFWVVTSCSLVGRYKISEDHTPVNSAHK